MAVLTVLIHALFYTRFERREGAVLYLGKIPDEGLPPRKGDLPAIDLKLWVPPPTDLYAKQK